MNPSVSKLTAPLKRGAAKGTVLKAPPRVKGAAKGTILKAPPPAKGRWLGEPEG